MTGSRLILALCLIFVTPSTTYAMEGLEENLLARLKVGEFGEPPCVKVGSFRPAHKGFENIKFNLFPGAHKILLVKEGASWVYLTRGASRMMLFSQSGFYSMHKTRYTDMDEVVHDALEFKLTLKGYMSNIGTNSECFQYLSYNSVELISVSKDWKRALNDMWEGRGIPHKVRVRLLYNEPFNWTLTPEFDFVFNNSSRSYPKHKRPVYRDLVMYRRDGKWLSSSEAMRIKFTIAGAKKRSRKLTDSDIDRLISLFSVENKAKKISGITVDHISKTLEGKEYKNKIAPCIKLPVNESDRTIGLHRKSPMSGFAIYDNRKHRKKEKYKYAIRYLDHLQSAGLVTKQVFDGVPFKGAPSGNGILYVISPELAKYDRPVLRCLPLGDGKLEDLKIIGMNKQRIIFKAWAKLDNSLPWTSSLGTLLPNVQTIIDKGYGIRGEISGNNYEKIRLKLDMPEFSINAKSRPRRFRVPKKKTKPFFTDSSPDDVARMQTKKNVVSSPDGLVRIYPAGCKISGDGMLVSKGHTSCHRAKSSRAFKTGKVYAEIKYINEIEDAHTATWTHAAVTSRRSVRSLSTGSASFSFTGSFGQKIKNGDLIGVAIDMDKNILYWHLNGNWMTGRPGTGIGTPLSEINEEYFIAVSVQHENESWRINFGDKSFVYIPPDGFRAYGFSH